MSRHVSKVIAGTFEVKKRLDQPDLVTAASMGAPTSQAAEQAFNMTPQDFLRTLPGVHAHNYRRLMNSVTNLRELSEKSEQAPAHTPCSAQLHHANATPAAYSCCHTGMPVHSRQELAPLVGAQNASKLHGFLHRRS